LVLLLNLQALRTTARMQAEASRSCNVGALPVDAFASDTKAYRNHNNADQVKLPTI
jgi:hypothetical protein